MSWGDGGDSDGDSFPVARAAESPALLLPGRPLEGREGGMLWRNVFLLPDAPHKCPFDVPVGP